jgi:hypothetical protein
LFDTPWKLSFLERGFGTLTHERCRPRIFAATKARQFPRQI